MFDTFDEFLDPGFRVPIGGTEYRVESPSASAVLRLHRQLADPAADQRTVGNELERIRPLLGATWDVLVRDGVAELKVLRLGRALVANYAANADVAVTYWRTGSFDTSTATRTVDEFQCKCKNECDGALTCKPGTYGPLDPGGGPYSVEFGDRAWYLPMYNAPALGGRKTAEQQTISWSDILECWTQLELDFQSIYSVDLDTDILDHRSWRWFELRVGDLVHTPHSRLRRALDARKDHHGDDPR